MLPVDIIQLCSELQYEFFSAGETIFNYGDFGNKFYIILKGKVEIKVPEQGVKVKPMNRRRRRRQRDSNYNSNSNPSRASEIAGEN